METDGLAAANGARATNPSGHTDIVRNAVGIGLASGAYAISFGAIATANGLSVWQTCFLSLVMFTGASQFALVGVLAGHGGGFAASSSAILLGTRNMLYGFRLSSLLELRGVRRLLGAQFVIDETTAMAIRQDDPEAGRYAFYATAICLFICWNVGTLIGGLGAKALADPRALGLDAAPPAAFLALMAPRIRDRRSFSLAVIAGCIALVLVSILPVGAPVIVAGVAIGGLAVLWDSSRRSPAPPDLEPA